MSTLFAPSNRILKRDPGNRTPAAGHVGSGSGGRRMRVAVDILIVLGDDEADDWVPGLSMDWNPHFTTWRGLWFSQDSKASLLASLSAQRAIAPCLVSQASPPGFSAVPPGKWPRTGVGAKGRPPTALHSPMKALRTLQAMVACSLGGIPLALACCQPLQLGEKGAHGAGWAVCSSSDLHAPRDRARTFCPSPSFPLSILPLCAVATITVPIFRWVN